MIRLRSHSTLAALAIACCGTLAADSPSPEESFRKGNTAFLEGDYTAAIAHYEAAAREKSSSALHFNLGTTYYHSGEYGRAILHLERALALQPGNREAQANLQRIRSLLELAPPTRAPIERFGSRLSSSAWVWTGSLLFWAGVFCWVLPHLYRRRAGAFRLIGTVALLGAVFCAAALYGSHQLRREAVLLHDGPLLVSPTRESPPAADARSGEMLRVIRDHHDFVFVRGTESSGWIARNAIGMVRVFDDSGGDPSAPPDGAGISGTQPDHADPPSG